MDEYLRESVTPRNPPFKKIVLWNSAFFQPGNDFRIGPGRDKLRKIGCPVWQCELTTNRTDVQNTDAVVFHYGNWTMNDLPEQRSSHQFYIFWSREAPKWRPYLPFKTDLMADFFNWTMTYRWDSDVVMPHGYIKPIGHVPLHPSDDQMKLYLSNPTGSVNNSTTSLKSTKPHTLFNIMQLPVVPVVYDLHDNHESPQAFVYQRG
ncbi:4-galactosyl-N-acetylglucosaminide 3-alpha-L-fucosyltransferase FUT5-like [Daphnia magna]|uniref:4-galactosyl-N-acetylglucosaminide 3-alpha-L-fucosyltransferase FUT5-like n=1 Tax=Daphnia magna TaxID=35525 RepID=UPI001E1BA6EC|nr:4-galactosyl-N-acetylglucosaminide 3-alpha-L-fucosyltransferase FUT5-like [Daphnia magna]